MNHAMDAPGGIHPLGGPANTGSAMNIRVYLRLTAFSRIKQKGPVNEASFTGPFCLIGAPGEIRTPDRSVRSRVLYPAELRARAWNGKAAHYAKPALALSRTTHGIWRRERDSNPRWRFKPPYSLSRGAPPPSSAISPCMRTQAYRGGRMAYSKGQPSE